jgi:N-acylneuraminate cytidylyltransferase
MIWPENIVTRSQDLKPTFHDAGQWYWFNCDTFLKENKLFTDNSGSIELDEIEVQDIDTETDWLLAELKYKIKHSL